MFSPRLKEYEFLQGVDQWRSNIPVRMGFLGEKLCHRLLFLHEAPHIQHNGAFFVSRSALHAALDRASDQALDSSKGEDRGVSAFRIDVCRIALDPQHVSHYL
jgi:hypothetical protein